MNAGASSWANGIYYMLGGNTFWAQGHQDSNNVVANAPAPGAGSWHHFAVAYSSSGNYAWIDGSPSNATFGSQCAGPEPQGRSPCLEARAGGVYLTGHPGGLGVSGGDNTINNPWLNGGLPGTYDNIRIYNRALTDADVTLIYQTELIP
jgi:hypothetical protein